MTDERTGLLAPAGDLRAFRRKLERALTNARLRSRLGVSARPWAERQKWPVILDLLLEIYREAIASARASERRDRAAS